MWCIQAYVFFFFPLLSLIHFSKCLPRRLNKCLGRWGKVNLGQTASRWTEGWVECVKVNCGPFSLIVSCFLFALKCDHGLTPNTADASEVRPASPLSRNGAPGRRLTQLEWWVWWQTKHVTELRGPTCCTLNTRHRQGHRYWVSYLKNVKGGL